MNIECIECIDYLWDKAWISAQKNKRPSPARIKTKNIIVDWFDPSVILFMESEISVGKFL